MLGDELASGLDLLGQQQGRPEGMGARVLTSWC